MQRVKERPLCQIATFRVTALPRRSRAPLAQSAAPGPPEARPISRPTGARTRPHSVRRPSGDDCWQVRPPLGCPQLDRRPSRVSNLGTKGGPRYPIPASCVRVGRLTSDVRSDGNPNAGVSVARHDQGSSPLAVGRPLDPCVSVRVKTPHHWAARNPVGAPAPCQGYEAGGSAVNSPPRLALLDRREGLGGDKILHGLLAVFTVGAAFPGVYEQKLHTRVILEFIHCHLHAGK